MHFERLPDAREEAGQDYDASVLGVRAYWQGCKKNSNLHRQKVLMA